MFEKALRFHPEWPFLMCVQLHHSLSWCSSLTISTEIILFNMWHYIYRCPNFSKVIITVVIYRRICNKDFWQWMILRFNPAPPQLKWTNIPVVAFSQNLKTTLLSTQRSQISLSKFKSIISTILSTLKISKPTCCRPNVTNVTLKSIISATFSHWKPQIHTVHTISPMLKVLPSTISTILCLAT